MAVPASTAGGRARRPLAVLLRSGRPWMTATFLLLAVPGAPGAAQEGITISGDPPPLVAAAAVAGSQPALVTASWTTYTVTAGAGQKITVALDEPLPPGVTLELTLAAPPGAVSAGPIVLSTLPQEAVLSLPDGTFSGLSIGYMLKATVTAGPIPPSPLLVTYTLTSSQ